MFFLYASTPGWSNGLTPNIYPLNAQAFSKKYTKYPKLYSSNFGILTIKFGTLPSVCANKVPWNAFLLTKSTVFPAK